MFEGPYQCTKVVVGEQLRQQSEFKLDELVYDTSLLKEQKS